MHIAIGSDHAGVALLRRIQADLEAAGHTVQHLGPDGTESVDYPDYAKAVAHAVATGAAERGVLVCGTGIGMSITANKVKGVRAALVHDRFTAEMARRHNDAQIVCFGARVLDEDTVLTLLHLFLDTPFEGGRHQRRVDKIHGCEG